MLHGHAPLLASHSFAARQAGWTQPGGVDISESQSYSCYKTRQPGDGDILDDCPTEEKVLQSLLSTPTNAVYPLIGAQPPLGTKGFAARASVGKHPS